MREARYGGMQLDEPTPRSCVYTLALRTASSLFYRSDRCEISHPRYSSSTGPKTRRTPPACPCTQDGKQSASIICSSSSTLSTSTRQPSDADTHTRACPKVFRSFHAFLFLS